MYFIFVIFFISAEKEFIRIDGGQKTTVFCPPPGDEMAFVLILLFYLFLYINYYYLVVYSFSFSVGY